MDNRDLYAGLIKLHVLHHAAQEPIYGLAMIEELDRHGYKLSAGTLYPILHGLEEKGYLVSTRKRNGSVERRVYRATRAGRAALASAKVKVRELFGELFEDEPEQPLTIYRLHLHRHSFKLTDIGVVKDVVMLGRLRELEFDFVADKPVPTLLHCREHWHSDFRFMVIVNYA